MNCPIIFRFRNGTGCGSAATLFAGGGDQRRQPAVKQLFLPAALAVTVLLAGVGDAAAQTLRFHLHRDAVIPAYSYVRIGPFYSDVRFAQSAAARYTSSRGAGTDFLRAQRRGRIRRDGFECPLITTLDFRNYLLLTRNADVDMSVRLSYKHYPLGTQRDSFLVVLPEEGIDGSFSTSFRLTPYLRGTLYDRMVYRTDYIDTRGLTDELGGRRYEFFRNTAGIDTDWLPAPGKNVSLSVTRTDELPQTREFRNRRRATHRETLAYTQMLRPYLAGGVRAAFTQTDYAVRERTDYHEQLYSAFADLALLRNATVDGWAGYSIIHTFPGSDAGDEDGSEGMQWGVNLNTGEGFWLLVPQLTHEIGFSRSVAEGFDTAYETVDRYRYRLGWNGIALRAGFSAELAVVDPSGRNVPGYENTGYLLDASYPLTSFARLTGNAGYNLRRNERRRHADTDVTAPPPERVGDYETLFWRLGTAFDVTRRILFEAHYQHNERLSEREELRAARDVAQAKLTFSHRF